MSKAQLRNCSNKRRFASKSEGLAVAVEKGLGVYACPVCAGFHLTSQTHSVKTSAKVKLEIPKPSFDPSLLARAKWKGKIPG